MTIPIQGLYGLRHDPIVGPQVLEGYERVPRASQARARRGRREMGSEFRERTACQARVVAGSCNTWKLECADRWRWFAKLSSLNDVSEWSEDDIVEVEPLYGVEERRRLEKRHHEST